MPLPAHLPRTTVVIEPKENIEGAKKIGEEITEVLEYTPGKLFVKQYIRPKFLLPIEKKIVIGQLPSLPIPRGNVGASLLAFIIVSKFVDHLPFYRQVKIFKRQNVNIAETTINGWFRVGCELLNPLYERHRDQILQSNYIMADETPIPVLSDDKPGATHSGYIWAYYDPINKNALFDYQETRSGKCPTQMLKAFIGAVQSDGYNAYNAFEKQEGIILLACMAHARRKFEDALSNDKTRAEQMLKLMQLLYDVEREAREQDFSFEKRYELRQEKSIPILNEMEVWLKENIIKVLPKSAIGKAIAYTLTLWKRLIRYVDDGKYEIDNNLIENSIRPIALGRKNYLFAGSHEAAQRIAMIYSFMGTCKLQEVEPYAWLCDVLTKLPDTKQSELSNLLPSNWKPV
jgi:transposase